MTPARVALCAALALVAAAVPAQDVPVGAVSADGRWRLEALDGTIRIFDQRRGELVRTLPGESLDRRHRSAIAAVHAAPPRASFVVSFITLAELWEISVDPDVGPIFDGYVHDYRQREAIATPGFLNPRRTPLASPLGALVFDASHAYVLGRAADDAQGRSVLHLVHLDVRRRIAEFALPAEPDLTGVASADCAGRPALAVPDRRGSTLLFVDLSAAARCPDPGDSARGR